MPEPKQKNLGGCLLFLFILIRGFRRSPLFSLVLYLSYYPLAIYLIVSAFLIGFDWRLIIILPFGLLLSAMVSAFQGVNLVLKNYGEIQEFRVKFNHCDFIPVPIDEFTRVIKEIAGNEPDENGKKPTLMESKLSDSEYFLGNHIRFIVVDEGDSEGPSLGSAVAYFLAEGSWIFLKNRPEDMTNLEKFVVLHEIGHTETLGNINFDYKGANLPILLSLPVVAVMVNWDLTTGIIFSVLCLILIWRYLHSKSIGKFVRFYDEVYADCFAFERSRKEWFGTFPAEKIADIYCSSMQSVKPDGLVKVDKPMTAEQAQVRRKIFIDNIERLRKGEEISSEAILDIIPSNRINAFDSIQSALIVALFVILGFQQAELTTTRFLIFSGLTAVMIFLALIVVLTPKFLARTVDYEFDYKKEEEFTEDERKQFDRMYKTREKLGKAKKKIDSATNMFGDKGKEYALAEGTTGRLFLSEEVDLYVEFKPLKSYIFHGKKIDYDISHLLYLPDNHSLIVVKKDDSRLDLGVKLGDELRPYFLKSKTVTITRTENREAVESIVVALHKVE